MPIEGAAGTVAVQSSFPQELRPAEPLTASVTKKLFTRLAVEHPDKYSKIIDELKDVSRAGASLSGAYPFGLRDIAPPSFYDEYRNNVNRLAIDYINKHGRMNLQDQEFAKKLAELSEQYYARVADHLKQTQNPVFTVVSAGIRGSPVVVKRFFLSEGVYPDSWDRLIPYPILNNFTTGLEPAEYWAANYGSKKGIIGTKLAPQDAGDVYKQLARVTHRLIVVAPHGKEAGVLRAVPAKTADDDLIGAYLAAPVLDFGPGTLITSAVLERLRSKGVDEVLVKSPIAGGPPDGLYSIQLGARGGELPKVGTISGLEAAQAVGERISQMSVGKKHMGAIAGGIGSVTTLVKQQINVPKTFPGGATHAQTSGGVTRIEPSALGGYTVTINGKEHYVPYGLELKVRVGDRVEAGDTISTGLPNPAELVRHKGIGEARRIFTDTFLSSIQSFGLPAHRRNVEIIARGLINWVYFNKNHKGYRVGDIVSYNALEHNWVPREGAKKLVAASAKGKFLEVPVLHYTIGTPITDSVINTLKKFGINEVVAHDDPPPFEGFIEPARTYLRYDPDFMARLFGSYQKRTIVEAAAYGGTSDTRSYSFVPALAEGTTFGKHLISGSR